MGELYKKILILACLGVMLLSQPCFSQDHDLDIVILASDTLTSSKRSIHGAKKIILTQHPEVKFHYYLISKKNSDNLSIVDSIKNNKTSLILTIGSSATKLAQDNFKNIPIVFSAVKYPVLSGFVNSINRPGKNITGASLDIPVDVQFKYYKKIIPNLKKVGVLYTENTESLIPQAKVIAYQLGIKLISIKVNNDKELPSALDSLCHLVGGVWSVADANLFKPKSTRYILLNTLRKGIPFMGFSRYIVESGALFALDFDYKAVGFQAGDIVNRILEGEKPINIRVTTADVIWFHYNENTAKRIHITIPEELTAVAKEVYR
ncbi:MAG: ABC transporter substrate-binding protein [Candidatus Zixiibacteriota bacterium]